MFDGTDLALAYGSPLTPPPMEPMQQIRTPPVAAPMQQAPQVPQVPQVHPATASHAVAPDAGYYPPEAMHARQPAGEDAAAEGMWDRLANRKGEVLKFFLLSLVVLLGISMDRMGSHYLNNYISRSFLGETQEFLVRLGYPVFVLLLLWILRAM